MLRSKFGISSFRRSESSGSAVARVRPATATWAWLFDIDQPQLERQRLACERVVAIEGDLFVVHVGDHDDELLSIRFELDLFADLWIVVFGEAVAADVHNEFIAMLAIGLIGRDGDLLFLSHLHAGNGFIEAGDNIAGADREPERFAAARAVELLPII